MSHHLMLSISDISQVGEARRAAARLALQADLSELGQGRLAIVVTELATNLVRHAGAGYLLLRTVSGGDGACFEVLSVDSGPGMADPGRCLEDGYSTGGTTGAGLGAVKRLSAEFDLFSAPSQGTIILARVSDRNREARGRPDIQWGAVSLPYPGEEMCGDQWSIAFDKEQLAVMIADGLGHGPLAALAAEAAVGRFKAHSYEEPRQILQHAHQSLSGTRGAAVATARFDKARRQLSYAGLGNISGTVVSSLGRQGLCSHNGTVGVQALRFQQFEYPCPESCLLIMHSDGLQSRWNFDKYLGLPMKHPALIAAMLHRDFNRGRDDVTVVVVRLP